LRQTPSYFGYGLLLAVALLVQPVMTDARKQSPDQPVTVQLDQPESEIRRFNPEHPPNPAPQIPPGLSAVTPYNFACYQESWLQDVDEFTDASGNVHVDERPSWFKIRLTLSTTTWLPNSASEKLREHEEGHVQIYKAIYEKRADASAKRAAEALIGQVFQGIGPDTQTAKNEIQHKVTQALCSQFHQQTRDIAMQADAKYDRMTDHGRNGVRTADAVRETIEQIVDQPAGQQQH
jgi:hypothetical protein